MNTQSGIHSRETQKTFQFPAGIMLLQKTIYNDQPVITAVIAGHTVRLPYATQNKRNLAFEKLDRRNAEIIYRSLELLVSEWEN